MTAAYRLTENANIVVREADNAFIPADINNKDWIAYATWVAKGNTPDPYVAPAQTPDEQFGAVVASGIQLQWTTSTALDAVYAIDPLTQINIMAEMVSIVANGTFGTGTTTRLWADINGTYRQFNIAAFKLFASAVQFYVNQLYAVKAELIAGQSASWPSNQVTING